MVSEIFVEKKILRDKIRKELESLTLENYIELSKKVSKNLWSFLNHQKVIQEKVQVGAYSPFEREPIWYQELEASLIRLSFPSLGKDLNQMCFRASTLSELIEKKDFGSIIQGPKESNEEVIPQLILIPGIAFNSKGERLGRGKGYFDRYLENYQGIRVGLCFELQLVDQIPTDVHDKKMQWLITEKNIYKIS